MSKFDKMFDQAFGGAMLPAKGGESRRAGDTESYIVRGVELPRVTSILSIAPGKYLMSWYAKRTAQGCAEIIASCQEVRDALGDDYCDERSPRTLDPAFGNEFAPRTYSLAEAANMILNYESRMREPERYRDYRGYVGTAMHHCAYQYGLSGGNIDILSIDYIQSIALQHCYFDDLFVARLDKLGHTTESFAHKIAFDARPYIAEVKRFMDLACPAYESHGLEACVVNFDEGFAGQEDNRATYERSNWEKAGLVWPFSDIDKARLTGDYKSSKSLSASYRYQVAAYAFSPHLYLFEQDVFFENQPVDGAAIFHIDMHSDEPGLKAQTWHGEKLVELYDGFLALCYYYHSVKDMPRASNSKHPITRQEKPRRGQRKQPPWEEQSKI